MPRAYNVFTIYCEYLVLYGTILHCVVGIIGQPEGQPRAIE